MCQLAISPPVLPSLMFISFTRALICNHLLAVCVAVKMLPDALGCDAQLSLEELSLDCDG